MNKNDLISKLRPGLAFIGTFAAVALLHYPMLRLPYFWDEAGYYIPAALDFFRHGLLIPQSTLSTGHTPLLSISLALAWHLLGYAPLITRLTMVLFATGTLAALYLLGHTLAERETAIWACALLALSALFFAQSTFAFLDLPAALTTTIAVWALLKRRMAWFALVASLSVLTKETAIVLVPVAIVYFWRFRKDPRKSDWMWLAAPVVVLGIWSIYYHHATGYWTGGAKYLQYNLYSTLKPGRIGASLVRRLYQVFTAGFNWILVGAALPGYRKRKAAAESGAGGNTEKTVETSASIRKEFFFITFGLAAVYIAMLSVVGGAVLARYLLPMFPCFYLALVLLVEALPRPFMRVAFVIVGVAFIASWFINPSYPFAYENNLSYADFVRLHQQASEWLSAQPGDPRVLTAWPATDELSRPELGYVKKPLRVVGVPNFDPPIFRDVPASSFDLVYLYSRKWDPPDNWLRRVPFLAHAGNYTPPIRPAFLALRYGLHQVAVFRRRGQWVRIYAKNQDAPQSSSTNF